jgi:hypothetical protein
MMMRYNIGLGVGHTYAHSQNSSSEQTAGGTRGSVRDEVDEEPESVLPASPPANVVAAGSDSEDLSVDDDIDMGDWEDDFTDRGESGDEEFFAMDEMYGFS